MIKKLLLLLVVLLCISVLKAQQASVMANCFYDNVSQRVIIRIAIRNNTGSASNCQIAAMRIGYQFNETVLTYDGYKSFMFEGMNESSGLNDASHLSGDFDDETTTPVNDGTRTATITSTGGTKTLRKNYFNRSTTQCGNLWNIPANTYRIAFDIYFKFKAGYTPADYNLNTPGYGFGTPNFIAQFIGSLTENLTDPKKEIALALINAGNSPYQPFDQSGSNCNGNNVNPVAINDANINFISPITGLLAGTIENAAVSNRSRQTAVEWDAANNEMIDRFEVQRRGADGDFKTIGIVFSDNSKGNQRYSFLDKMGGTAGNEFQYRIKVIGNTGEEQYSSVMQVKIRDGMGQQEIRVFTANGTIHVELPSPSEMYVCRVYNANGALVLTARLNQNQSNINAQALASGCYYLEAIQSRTGERFNGRFVRQ